MIDDPWVRSEAVRLLAEHARGLLEEHEALDARTRNHRSAMWADLFSEALKGLVSQLVPPRERPRRLTVVK